MRVSHRALLALHPFLVLTCFGCAAALPPSVVNYGRLPSVESPRATAYSGTGFVWNGAFVITAAHALADDRPSIVVPDGTFSSRTIGGRVVMRDRDVALVKLDVSKGESLPSLDIAPRDLVPGEHARILDGGFGSGRTLDAVAVFPDSVRIARSLGSIDYGSSGSPIVNDRNEVVGIVFGTIRSGGENLVSLYTATEIRRALALQKPYWPVTSR
jgi:S1-C subfamily serine protease